MDFGFEAGGNQTAGAVTPQTQEPNANQTQEPTGGTNTPPVGGNGNNGTQDKDKENLEDDPNGGNAGNNGNNNNNNSTDNNNENGDLEPGTQIEFEGKDYVVDDNGNIVDTEGNVFKEAKDVKAFLESLDSSTGDLNEIDINAVREAVGIELTDENGNAIEFENNIDGLKAYVTQAIESAKEDNQKEAIEILFNKYPILNDVLNYYLANGNSMEGYNELPDRSTLTVDEENVEQQESIIKTAWREQGRKGNVNGYIEYLKSTGNLFSVAKEELSGLQESDKQMREQREEEARRIEMEEQKNAQIYWNKVQGIIKSKKIGKYRIPDTIVRNINNGKVAGSIDDFFNYLYRVDKEGKSAYVRDLEKRDAEEMLNDDILRAYLTYSGGNYDSLVSMAINDQKVKKLKLVAKNNRATGTKVNPPSNNKDTKVNFGL